MKNRVKIQTRGSYVRTGKSVKYSHIIMLARVFVCKIPNGPKSRMKNKKTQKSKRG